MSVARDAKEAYSQRPRASISKPGSGTGTPNSASRKSSSAANDEDLDLDFIVEPTSLLGGPGFGKVNVVAASDGAAVIQQPLHRAILEHRPSLSASVSPTTAAPVHHPSALSRALANTVGRLGRWKRALNSGSRHAGNPTSMGVSAFDLELNPNGDLFQVRGGMDQYLDAIGKYPGPITVAPPLPPSISSLQRSVDPLSLLEPPPTVPSIPPLTLVEDIADDAELVPIPSDESSSRTLLTLGGEEAVDVASEAVTTAVSSFNSLLTKTSNRVSSSSTSSSSSYGVPVGSQSIFHARRSAQDRSWQLDVVSIDDLDLSDTSSDTSEGPMAQPGLKKLPRRLPLRRDFEFVDRNRESVSSMGFASQDGSGASGPSSRRSSVASGVAAAAGLGNTIQQWQVNALIDSLSEDEDVGDVEDALRRLEGQMNL